MNATNGDDLLIAEEVMLLMLDDATGRVRGEATISSVLPGAIVAEVALQGRLAGAAAAGVFSSATFAVADGPPIGDEALDGALERLAGAPMTMGRAIDVVAPGLHDHIVTRLAHRGILRPGGAYSVGFSVRTSWPAVDSTHEHDLRALLGRVLVEGEMPDARTAIVIGLVWASGELRKVLPFEGAWENLGVSPAMVAARAQNFAHGQWAQPGVREAVLGVKARIDAYNDSQASMHGQQPGMMFS